MPMSVSQVFTYRDSPIFERTKPGRFARLHAVPIAWVGGATFPVRAYVIVEDEPSGG
jgi:kynurenine formamidase